MFDGGHFDLDQDLSEGVGVVGLGARTRAPSRSSSVPAESTESAPAGAW